MKSGLALIALSSSTSALVGMAVSFTFAAGALVAFPHAAPNAIVHRTSAARRLTEGDIRGSFAVARIGRDQRLEEREQPLDELTRFADGQLQLLRVGLVDRLFDEALEADFLAHLQFERAEAHDVRGAAEAGTLAHVDLPDARTRALGPQTGHVEQRRRGLRHGAVSVFPLGADVGHL